ncbi:uncharacterized protein LOC104873748 [Fukomys damarensis]|uniref:uncharacterized protein LOC104873748 n=1 Tax=Fukomys damarensis TaxID=885580 RepID=UPI0014559355|nr:uncharacterized protein LOC104873748 [Fukomys damarensis]
MQDVAFPGSPGQYGARAVIGHTRGACGIKSCCLTAKGVCVDGDTQEKTEITRPQHPHTHAEQWIHWQGPARGETLRLIFQGSARSRLAAGNAGWEALLGGQSRVSVGVAVPENSLLSSCSDLRSAKRWWRERLSEDEGREIGDVRPAESFASWQRRATQQALATLARLGPAWHRPGGSAAGDPGCEVAGEGRAVLAGSKRLARHLASPSRRRHSKPPPGRGTGKLGRRGVGSFAQAVLRLQAEPAAELPTCCCPDPGCNFLLPFPARLPELAARVEEEAAAGSLRWQLLEPRVKHPPLLAGCDWPAAAGGGASGAGIAWTASKEPRILQSALERLAARSLPGAGKLGLGDSALLRLPRFYKPLDLTCLGTSHFYSMSPRSGASNRTYCLDVS